MKVTLLLLTPLVCPLFAFRANRPARVRLANLPR